MADGVARSPSRLCSIDGKICCYGDALSTIFLLACFFCALLPTFRFLFFFFFFPASRYVCLSSSCPFACAAAICYSSLSKDVYYSTCSFCLLCHLYPTPSRNSFVLLFERSEFLIDTPQKKNPSVRLCVRLILVLVWVTRLILVLVWGTYYVRIMYVCTW